MVIAYEKDFMKICGVKAGIACLILCQLYYWAKKMNFKPFYKTDSELANETGVSKKTIEKHKKKFKDLSFLKIYTKGCPQKTIYEFSNVLHMGNSISPTVGYQNPLVGDIDTLRERVSYIEQKNTTEDYNKEEEARASNPSPALPLPFLESIMVPENWTRNRV